MIQIHLPILGAAMTSWIADGVSSPWPGRGHVGHFDLFGTNVVHNNCSPRPTSNVHGHPRVGMRGELQGHARFGCRRLK